MHRHILKRASKSTDRGAQWLTDYDVSHDTLSSNLNGCPVTAPVAKGCKSQFDKVGYTKQKKRRSRLETAF